MDNKASFSDFHRDADSNHLTSEDTVETDFTLVASCALPDKTGKAKNREIKAELVREYIAAGKNQPLSIKQKILKLLS
jgi:hypothetical protein